MSYVCKRGYKCMCFQCGEKDCEHFENEPPKWGKYIFENEEIKEKLKRISEPMSDLISRQAEIDEIDSLYFDTIDDQDRAKEKIKRLSSAQPDLSGYSDKLWKLGFESGRKFERAERGWIPCSERLPEEMSEVLGTDTDGYIRHVVKDKCGSYEFATYEEMMHIPIIAWMPLPEPYKGEQE